jgi:HSP20 family protein
MATGRHAMAAEKKSETKPGGELASRPSEGVEWFDRWFGEFPIPMPRWADLWRGFGESGSMLRVEEFTEGDEVVVRAELPGIDPDQDVEITVENHTLRLRAERRQESRTEDQHGYRSEFRYGSFSRAIPLPAGATDQDVKATYKDGVLEVRVPLDHEEQQAKKIAVQRG